MLKLDRGLPPYVRQALFLPLSLLTVAQAQAAGSNMPWEAPLQAVLDSSGPGRDHRGDGHHRHRADAGLR